MVHTNEAYLTESHRVGDGVRDLFGDVLLLSDVVHHVVHLGKAVSFLPPLPTLSTSSSLFAFLSALAASFMVVRTAVLVFAPSRASLCISMVDRVPSICCSWPSYLGRSRGNKIPKQRKEHMQALPLLPLQSLQGGSLVGLCVLPCGGHLLLDLLLKEVLNRTTGGKL